MQIKKIKKIIKKDTLKMLICVFIVCILRAHEKLIHVSRQSAAT